MQRFFILFFKGFFQILDNQSFSISQFIRHHFNIWTNIITFTNLGWGGSWNTVLVINIFPVRVFFFNFIKLLLWLNLSFHSSQFEELCLTLEKRFKICCILCTWKTQHCISVFHFVQLYFHIPNQCLGLWTIRCQGIHFQGARNEKKL